MPLTTKLKPWLKHHIRKLPMLEKALRFLMAKGRLLDWKHRRLHRWFADNPKDDLRFQYNLPSGASILDVGGYNGDFAARFLELYRELAERLQHTHRLQWRYPFVWESWERRDIHKTRTGSNG